MKDMHLLNHKDWGHESNRKGFGRGLVKAAEADENVVALCADLTGTTQTEPFAEKFPERFVEVGVAEQNLVTVASGMTKMGKIPFAVSYAAFSPGRNWEQIKTTICLNDVPVKIIGSHAGLNTGPDGATHQMLEDVALMRVLPNMVVVVPGDSIETEKATVAIAKHESPCYLRLTREASPIISTEKTPFEIGKAYVYSQGEDVTVISNGTMTPVALEAAERLFVDGIDLEVIHCPTVKPLDTKTIIASAKKTGHVITIEDGQASGGLGGAVAELLGEELPTSMIKMGVKDKFGQSGTPSELLNHYGLTVKHLMLNAHHILSNK